MNGDQVMTINEFNDAFHRISETHEVKTEKAPLDRVIPKIHLDMALATNHVSSHVGDNIEIKCDITGAATSSFIWKRFGFDLSQVRNDTADDYEDDDTGDAHKEVKLMADGGLYIQNVQMKHAGNYSCAASSNGLVVQTHIVNVHPQPIILVSPEMQSKRPGESAEITCHSLGEYAASLGWLKNDKPIEQNEVKYTIIGNGTVLKINDLSYFDTSTYTCTSINGHSSVSTLLVQNEPNAIAVNRDPRIFVFHSNGISIYSSGLCQLVHEIRASDLIPGSDDSVCHQYARRCTWGQAVVIDGPDGLIYVTQPMMNRLLVLSISQLIIIEVIPTDGTPMELFSIPLHDQLWIVNYNLHRDGTIKVDPSKTLQMIPDVRMLHVKHHPIHPESINGDMMNFYAPPDYPHRNHVFDYKNGLITHHKQRGFFKLDLSTLRYAKYVDLSIYDCVPEHIKFGGLCKLKFEL
jgi:follistatin-related protein 5